MRDKRRARLRCTSLIMRAHIAEGVGRGPHMPAGSELAMNFCAYRVFMKGRGWLREHSADHFKERGGFHRMPRSLLKYPCAPRENALGWMARRERRAYPQWSVRSERRRQTAQSALARRVASLFGLAGVAPQSQTAAGMLLRRALARSKTEATRGTWVFQQTPNVQRSIRARSCRAFSRSGLEADAARKARRV